MSLMKEEIALQTHLLVYTCTSSPGYYTCHLVNFHHRLNWLETRCLLNSVEGFIIPDTCSYGLMMSDSSLSEPQSPCTSWQICLCRTMMQFSGPIKSLKGITYNTWRLVQGSEHECFTHKKHQKTHLATFWTDTVSDCTQKS